MRTTFTEDRRVRIVHWTESSRWIVLYITVVLNQKYDIGLHLPLTFDNQSGKLCKRHKGMVRYRPFVQMNSYKIYYSRSCRVWWLSCRKGSCLYTNYLRGTCLNNDYSSSTHCWTFNMGWEGQILIVIRSLYILVKSSFLSWSPWRKAFNSGPWIAKVIYMWPNGGCSICVRCLCVYWRPLFHASVCIGSPHLYITAQTVIHIQP